MGLRELVLSGLVAGLAPAAAGCLDDQVQPPPFHPPQVELDASVKVDAGAIDASPPPPDAQAPEAGGLISTRTVTGSGGVVSVSPHYKLITSTNDGTRGAAKSQSYKFNGGVLQQAR